MIVIVTNREDYTADFLILELQKRNSEYVRFNTEDFPQKLQVVWSPCERRAEGFFVFPKISIGFSQIKSIWYRRPVSPAFSDDVGSEVRDFVSTESWEALSGIWRTLDCFWVSHPDKIRVAEFKLYQLRVAKEVGFKIPQTIVTNQPEQAQRFFQTNQRRVVYKPLRHSRIVRGEQVGLIFTNPVSEEKAQELGKIQYAPSLLQEYIQKELEVRVTVIGSTAFAAAIYSQELDEARHDWRRANVSCLRHEPHQLPVQVEDNCIALVNALGLEFGAIDLILTPEGEYVFLEINPNGQWAWLQQTLPDLPLKETLADLLIRGRR